MQLVLPDYPVTQIISVQQGAAFIPPSVLPVANQPYPVGTAPGYGYRFIPWAGNLPGDNAVLELNGGYFWTAPQNIRVMYVAGYLEQNEAQTVPDNVPWQITVNQPQGIWSRDNGVTYALSGLALTPVKTITGPGQYIAPPDTAPGLYTFGVGDEGAALLFNYSFIPADLEEACVQMVVERYNYRTRVGEISKSLGGQETMRYFRGNSGPPWNRTSSLPPEVNDLIQPYISVLPPVIGAPV